MRSTSSQLCATEEPLGSMGSVLQSGTRGQAGAHGGAMLDRATSPIGSLTSIVHASSVRPATYAEAEEPPWPSSPPTVCIAASMARSLYGDDAHAGLR
jgi:hypothetical protein